MTASTPHPADSGAAASRDAARTARRLTDGTLPRTSPPLTRTPPPDPAADAAAGSGAGPLAGAGAEEGAVGVASAAPAAPAAPTTPSGEAPGLPTAPVSADRAPSGPATAPAADTPTTPTAPSAPAGTAEAAPPASPSGDSRPVDSPVAPRADATAGAAAGSGPADPLRATPVGSKPVGARSDGSGTVPSTPATPTAPAAHAAPTAPAVSVSEEARGERPGGSAPASPPTPTEPAASGHVAGFRIADPAAARPVVSSFRVTTGDAADPAPARPTGDGPAGSAPAGPAAGAPVGTPASPGPGTSPPARPAGASTGPAASGPDDSGPARPAGAASSAVGGAPAASSVTAPVGGRPEGAAREPDGPGAPAAAFEAGAVTRKSAEVFAAAAVRSGGTPAVPVAVPAEEDREPAVAVEKRVPDFGKIAGAGVGAVAVPVAAAVRAARRKNVIGAETTGSIPVHLLFRDEPGAPGSGAAGDDGGPDTVAMAPPLPLAASPLSKSGGKTAIPAPSKTQASAAAVVEHVKRSPQDGEKPEKRDGTPRQGRHARHARQEEEQGPGKEAGAVPAKRPVPTADPALVERPGPALPGWVGVAAGALAIAGSAAVVWWTGVVPEGAARMLRLPVRPYHGIHLGQWALLALGVVATLFALGGLGRGRVGYAWVLTLFGDYRGTVRRTGLVWVSPLLLRRRVDVRLRHWRSEPLSAVDAKGTALDVTVLVVWRVRDTVRAALGVDGHEEYLREQVEAAMARVLSQLPADAFHEDAPTLRDAEAVGEALTRMLSAECAPVGVDVFSAQPTRIEYAPEVAAAMQRRRIAAIDAKHRDSVLTSVVDAVDDVVHRLTSRGLVELDDYERKALVKDLTVAFYTGRTAPAEGA
ncbi:SPFH domain-containing protein [Streptomyces sp. NPDC059491]|uniref:SPFH domain-containing protein n=1 Tax=Streptomyces sp. NPDC059491 TaxID=3346850 RepID=UPI00368AD4A1